MMTAKRPPEDSSGPPPPSGVRSFVDSAKLFREVLPCIFKMARNRGFDEQGQQDIAQTVGEILVRQHGDHDPARGTAVQWAVGIAKNVIRTTARRQRTERRYIDAAPNERVEDRPALDLTPEERARARDALARIGATLTEEQREIFELTAEQHTAEEIAGILGLTRSRVEQRIREARERLTGLLARMGEDKASATNVRGVVLLPFTTVEDLHAAVRAGRVRDGVADELWRRVTLHTAGSLPLPAARQLVYAGGGVVLSPSQLGVGGTALLLTGATVGIAIFSALSGDRTESASILSEPALALVLAAPSSPSPNETTVADRRATRIPPVTANGAAPSPPVRTSTDPAATDPGADPVAAADEGTLLRMALGASPTRALELASEHARRFPSQQVGKRELVIVRALVSLGRRSEAEARARALKGTVYEKAITDALSGLPL